MRSIHTIVPMSRAHGTARTQADIFRKISPGISPGRHIIPKWFKMSGLIVEELKLNGLKKIKIKKYIYIYIYIYIKFPKQKEGKKKIEQRQLRCIENK